MENDSDILRFLTQSLLSVRLSISLRCNKNDTVSIISGNILMIAITNIKMTNLNTKSINCDKKEENSAGKKVVGLLTITKQIKKYKYFYHFLILGL